MAQKIESEIFLKAEERILWTIEKNNGIIEEERIIAELSGKDVREANAVAFFGASSDKINIIEEKNILKKSWVAGREAIAKVKEIGKIVEEIFAKEKNLLTSAEISKRITNKKPELSAEQALNYLDILAGIKKNRFEKWGPVGWKEVSPKGTRERIYLVLKEKKKPLHFTEIAKLIDEYQLGKKKAHPQTVHNELIKDERFVLVGRGIYALKEWGYEKGTIKDVLEDILKQKAVPMGKEEILSEVLRRRKVKKATVMINLNNQKIFVKQNSGWTIRK